MKKQFNSSILIDDINEEVLWWQESFSYDEILKIVEKNSVIYIWILNQIKNNM